MKKLIALLAALAVVTTSSLAVMAEDAKTEEVAAETKVEETVEATEEVAEEATEEAAEEVAEEATEEAAEETTEEVTEEAEAAVDYAQFNGEGIEVVVFGEKVEFDIQPEMQNDRVMVPVRAIFEALGATVNWDNETETVMAVKDERVVMLQIGNTKMFVNGVETEELDAPPYLKDDSRTLVPVRAISEAFECNVEWIDEYEMVVVSEKAAEEATEEATEETTEAVDDKSVDTEADAENAEATEGEAAEGEEAIDPEAADEPDAEITE